MHKVKIVSDGTPMGTKVLLANGEPMPGFITKIEWSISANRHKDGGPTFGTAVIEFGMVAVEAVGYVPDRKDVPTDQT